MDFLQQTKKTTTTGRKKIEIKEIDKDANKQVTFSKRRAGLFKKASELCVLCDAHLAIIVFSPANKVFCFGHSNVDTVLRRYLHGVKDPATATPVSEIASNSASYEELNREHEEAVKALEMEKQQLTEIQNLAKGTNGIGWNRGNWWKESVDEMGLEELEQYVVAMNELRRKVSARADELMMRAATMMIPSTAPFYGESSMLMGGVHGGMSNYGGFVNQFGGDLVGDHRKFGF